MYTEPSIALDASTETLSDEAFFRLASQSDYRYERDANGKIYVMPPTGGETGWRNSRLTTQVGVYEINHPDGYAFDSSTGYTLPNTAVRSPDASWVAAHRYEALTPHQRTRYLPLAPDFLIELRSPSDTLSELFEKMAEYMANGVQQAWLLDPDTQGIWIYRQGTPEPEYLQGFQRELSVGELMPGFALNLRLLLARDATR